MFFTDSCQVFDIDDVEAGVRRCFYIQHFGVGPDQGFHRFRLIHVEV